jgi:hypothetical protein
VGRDANKQTIVEHFDLYELAGKIRKKQAAFVVDFLATL